VSFASTTTGVAVGGLGAPFRILRTIDGGVTWTPVSAGTAEILTGVRFDSPTDGLVVGYNAKILHTTDGGLTWAAEVSGASSSLNSVSFAGTTAIAVGYGGTILRSLGD
jgi:photosystem II stability/assembly factor-like uncharacterized protein